LLKVEAHKSYLLFLELHPQTKVFYPSGSIMLVEGGRLVNPWKLERDAISDGLHGLSIEVVARQIRALVK
jgi:hypothetical protein